MKFRIVGMIRFLFVLLLIPMVGLLIYINVFAIGRMTDEAIVSHGNALQMQVDKIDKNLVNASAFVRNMVVNNQEVALLNMADEAAKSYYLFVEIQERLSEFAVLDNGMNEFFFQAPNSLYPSYYSAESAGMTDTWMRSRINARVRQRFDELRAVENFSLWEVHEVDGNYCLMYFMKGRGVYMGAWCLTGELLKNIPLSGGNERILIAGEDGTALSSAGMGASMQGLPLDLAADYFVDADGKEYIQLAAKSEAAGIYVVDIVDKEVIIGSLLLIKNVILILSGILLVLLAGTYVVFDKILHQPVRRLVAAMERVRSGDLTGQVESETKLVEFQLMNETFNHMVREIQDLKIRVYEEQLREKETKLQYLQIQIRPHFLVNVLNVIYSMAEVEDYKGIQSLSMYLVNYFRFMFNKATSRVTVAQELEHVKNYMGIQEARFPDSFYFHAHVDERAGQMELPPLTIQTFIENSIKYAMDMEQENHIWLDICASADGYDIVIRDNGKGFSESLMARINSGEPPEGADETHHIGIVNVISRLKLIYGDNAFLKLENEAGAKVIIHLPA